jgi:arylsulfatase A-like enzyme
VLISIDTLRADHLACYGYERATSPALDALAAEGVRFERCVASSSWTLPSHLTMLTGLPVAAHGIDHDGLWQRTDAEGAPVAPDLRGRFLAETLQAAGYRTEGYYTWKYLEPRFGFGAGFDRYERLGHTFLSDPVVGPRVLALEAVAKELGAERARLEQQRAASGASEDGIAAELDEVARRLAEVGEQGRALRAAHPELFGEVKVADQVVDRGIAALEQAQDAGQQPLFLFLHLFDVHDPYVSPEPFHSRFDPDYQGPIDGRRVTTGDSLVQPQMAPRDLQNLIARYDGGIAWVDSQLARLFARLEDLGLARDTLVVVTSDHGEEFFEHGGKTHRGSVYPEVLCVPLLMRWPAGLPSGVVVEGTAGLVDLVPTLTAAAGLDHGAPSGGRDLVALARSGSIPERPLTAEVVADAPGGGVLHRSSLVEGARQRVRDVSATQETWGELDLSAAPPIPVCPTDEDLAREAFLRALQRLVNLRGASPHRTLDASPLTELEQRELAAMGYAGGAGGSGPDGERSTFEGGVHLDARLGRER